VLSVVSTNLSTITATRASGSKRSPGCDVLYWAVHPALYRRIRMAIEIASDSPAFFVVAKKLLPTNIDIAK